MATDSQCRIGVNILGRDMATDSQCRIGVNILGREMATDSQCRIGVNILGRDMATDNQCRIGVNILGRDMAGIRLTFFIGLIFITLNGTLKIFTHIHQFQVSEHLCHSHWPSGGACVISYMAMECVAYNVYVRHLNLFLHFSVAMVSVRGGPRCSSSNHSLSAHVVCFCRV